MWHPTCSVQFLYAVNTSSPACRQEGRSPPPPLQPREFPFSSSNIFLPSVPPRRWNPRIFSVSGDPWSKLQISVQEQGKSLTFVFFLLSDSPVHLAANWLPSVKTITLSCCSPGNLTADSLEVFTPLLKNSIKIQQNTRQWWRRWGMGEKDAWICGSWGFAFKWFGVSGAKGHPSHPSAFTQTLRREMEKRCYRSLAARAPTFSCIHNVAEDQKSELSLLCQVCRDKMLGAPSWWPLPVSHTHNYAGEHWWWRDLLVWPANHFIQYNDTFRSLNIEVLQIWVHSAQNTILAMMHVWPLHTNWQVKRMFGVFISF